MEDQDAPRTPLLGSCRLALALVGFLGFVNLYALRVNLSLAMVCMVNYTALEVESTSGIFNSTVLQALGNDTVYEHESDKYNLTDQQQTSQCTLQNGGVDQASTMQEGSFDWDKETQGIVLGAFFWGYMCTQLLGGYLAGRYGGKHVLGWSMFVAAIATLLTPLGASYSPYFLVALRVIVGFGEGVVFPAMHALWSCWAPPLERTTLIGFTYAGAQIGNVLTIPISALLCEYGFAGGWPSIFYVFGGIGVLWFALWLWFVSDSPSRHPRISQAEKKYIISTQGADMQRTLQEMGTPWLTIMSSRHCWAIFGTHWCTNWGTFTLLTNMPTFMKEVLQFDLKKNGFLCSIPYLLFWLFIVVSGQIADKLRSVGFKTMHVRKFAVVLGTLVPGVCLVGLGHIPRGHPAEAVALLSIATGFCGFQYSGLHVNHLDIAPPFAGLLFGLSNTLASTPGILAPYTVGRLTTTHSPEEWLNVFYIACAIYICGMINFLINARGDILPWVEPYIAAEAEQHPLLGDDASYKSRSECTTPRSRCTSPYSPTSPSSRLLGPTSPLP